MKDDHHPYKNEKELLSRLKSKDREAVSCLYDAYGPPLYGMLLRMLGDEAKAGELLKLTFVRSLEKIDNFDPQKRSLFTYMWNISRDLLKELPAQGERMHHKGNHLNQSRSTAVNHKEGSKSFAGLQEHLTAEQRALFQLLFLEGNSQEAIATKRNASLPKIRSLVRATMLKIRELLSKEA